MQSHEMLDVIFENSKGAPVYYRIKGTDHPWARFTDGNDFNFSSFEYKLDDPPRVIYIVFINGNPQIFHEDECHAEVLAKAYADQMKGHSVRVWVSKFVEVES